MSRGRGKTSIPVGSVESVPDTIQPYNRPSDWLILPEILDVGLKLDQTAGGDDNDGIAGGGSTYIVGQVFKAEKTGELRKITLKMWKLGSPGTFTLELRDTNAQFPGTTILATTTKIVSDFSTSATEVDFIFDTPYSVISGNYYSFVFYASGQDDNNSYNLKASIAGDYGFGVLYYSTLPFTSWSGGGETIYFKTYVYIGQTYEEKVIGLFAVTNNDSNFCTISCRGAYTIDWGDGTTIENIADNVKAEHNFIYNNLSPSTECSRGYRQSIVTIIPQSGSNLTVIDFSQKHSSLGTNSTSTQWLDIKMAGAFINAINIYSATSATTTRFLEQFEFIGINSITSFNNQFRGVRSLQNLVSLDTSNSTNFQSMFNQCSSLKTIPLLNTSNGTAFTNMFSACGSLQTIPLLDTSNSLDFSNMFFSCYALQSIPLLNTSNGILFNSMFDSCYDLQTIPLLDTSKGTTFAAFCAACYKIKTIPLLNTSNAMSFESMFSSCYALQSIPLLNTSKGTNFSYMFYNCASLKTIPLLDTSKGTTFFSMFFTCNDLQFIPNINTSNGTNFSSMFQNCRTLQYLPLLDTAKGTDFSNMFNSCTALQTISTLDVTLGTTFANMFASCFSLKHASLTETSKAITYTNCQLSTSEIINIFNGLKDFTETMTINVAPAIDWALGDIITGQTSGTYCIVVAKLTNLTYTVKSRYGSFTSGEVIGVTGDATKLATQLVGAPTFAGRATAQITISTGNWGWAFLTTNDKTIAWRKGWTTT